MTKQPDKSGKFRRIAVLGVTSLGTWAIVPVVPPPDGKSASPPAPVVKQLER